MATFMLLHVFILFIPSLSKRLNLSCAPGEKYICTGLKTNLTDTIVTAGDTTICEGVCDKSFCSGTWSSWSTTTPVVYGPGDVLIQTRERRYRPCGNEKGEIEFRHENIVCFKNCSKQQRMKRRISKSKGLSGTFNRLIDISLKTIKANFVVPVGNSVKLSCDTLGQETLKHAFPKSKINWVLNNHKLKIDASRMKVVQRLNLEIRNVNPHDQGLYTCRVIYKPKRRKTVYFATITTKEVGVPIEIKATETLKLRCPSSPIGRMFWNSFRDWTLNGKRRVGNIPAKYRSSEKVRNASKSLEGLWSCHVTDRSTKRRWDVVNFQIIVVPLPPPDNSFKKFFLNNIILIISQSLGVLGFIIVIFIVICHKPKSNKTYNNENEKLLGGNVVETKDI